MGNRLTLKKDVFHWEYTEEPHKSRRIDILSKHPEIKKLMRIEGDRRLVFQGILLSVIHIAFGFVNQWLPYAPLRFALIFGVGTWFTTAIMLHVHEAAHGLVFGPNHVWKNRIYGLLINLPMGLPFYSYFKKHHKSHHKALGDEILDCEYPAEIETVFFPNTPLTKYIWLLAQPIIYTVRTPMLVVQRSKWGWDSEELLNLFTLLALDAILFYFDLSQVINYMFCTSLMASQSNMFGFWGLMSHTEFLRNRETSCYYGWLNKIYINFGYHVEHHDFPSVPSRYLPKVHEIAPEFYEENFVMNSFVVAVIKFLFDEKVGIHSRLRRPNKHPEQYSLNGSDDYRIFKLENSSPKTILFCNGSARHSYLSNKSGQNGHVHTE